MLLVVFSALPVWSTDVPFSAGHTIDGEFDGAFWVRAADIDGDGDLDVVGIANPYDFNWWENLDGTGTTWMVHSIAPFGPLALDVADVDGDGDLDLLGAEFYLDAMTWWENSDGLGTSWTPHSFASGFDAAHSVRAADVDGDGDLDVVGAAIFANAVTWWENLNGAGTSWAAQPIDEEFAGANNVDAADIDGDGDIDVLGTAYDADDITWWENLDGAGTSWAEHTIDPEFDGARWVHAADMDSDGDVDVVGAADGGSVTWWENLNAAGTSWTPHLIDGSFHQNATVESADLDGDGDLDVLATAHWSPDITWWENLSGTGTSWNKHTIPSEIGGPASVHAADVDGDGDLDVLGATYFADDITWWENKTIHRNALFPIEHTIEGGFDGADAVYAADMDGDGDLDVLGTALFADAITWWENLDGAGASWVPHPIDDDFDGVSSVHAADVDGDGDLDVLGAAFFAGDITWWENVNSAGTSWTEHTIDGEFDGAASAHAADVDGDGDLDVLGAGFYADAITWWENLNGMGTSWAAHTIDDHFDGARTVHAADMDRDGDLDVVGATPVDDDIVWWENLNGAGTSWTTHTIDGDFDGAASVYVADVDGDGDLDALGAAAHANDITWWENLNGVGTIWSVHAIDGEFDFSISVYAADMDGDGDLDVLGAAQVADDITWWENVNGAGTSWFTHTIDAEFDGARAVHAADLDGDGDLDVLATAHDADDITWWANRGGQFALPTTSLAASSVTVPVAPVVLQVDAVHNGRTGDTDAELVSFELLFDDGAAPLTDVQANSAIENLRVYRDDGSGDFDANEDFLVLTVSSLSLTAGVQQVSFADGNPDAQVVFGAPQRYFVVLDLVSVGLVNRLRVTHLTESSSTGEDRDHDIPLKLEFSFNTSTPLIELEDGPEAACPPDLVRANQTLTGTQDLKATSTATLGPNLIVNGADITVSAPEISILPDTTISGIFSVGNNPACP